MSAGRRLLVTGGAGFIGSNFVRLILREHPEDMVVVLDKLTYAGNRENLAGLEAQYPGRYRFVQGDIADPTVVGPLAAECEVIVNFAAETHVDRSIVDPSTFLITNIMGTQTLLDAALRTRRPGQLFLQISTDEVYGSLTAQETPFREDSPLRPNSPYAASKAAADLLVRSYQVTHGLPVVITRSSNNFGPYQYPEKFIPLAITNALEQESVPLYGDGMNVRDWIYVEDNCRAIDLVSHAATWSGAHDVPVFNIGGSSERHNIEVLKAILSATGSLESLIRKVPNRPGHDFRYALSTEKLQRETRWRPTRSFEQGLEQTIAWYRSHPEWWKPLKQRAAVHWLAPAKGT